MSSTFRFLDLPAELGQEIYIYALSGAIIPVKREKTCPSCPSQDNEGGVPFKYDIELPPPTRHAYTPALIQACE
ncbi:hypothetical protein LTS18_007173 [Coniosporium uncinatum]|uniref:Uncharacterized protein n=1 Tax=Coniosporium uncinatum TaxID=93489 RepID=A0ACC3D2V0_9PEZI|nr:hypothetical protein LTS18_007173 [Coniosporium uncinatum]